MTSTIPSVLERARSACLLALVALVSLAMGCAALDEPGSTQPSGPMATNWVATWGTAPAGNPVPGVMQTFNNQTLRLIVHTSIGGSKLRIRLSNEHGSTPLRIGEARVALRSAGADIVPGSDRRLTFSGKSALTVPVGALALSDPVELAVPALSDLAISLHLPGKVQAATSHGNAYQTNYVSLPGNFTNAAALPTQRTIVSWPFLTDVDVRSPTFSVVILGDSITDGAVTTRDANHRWPDFLALRLQTARTAPFAGVAAAHNDVGIINRGIGGNRLLRDLSGKQVIGRAALARFEREVLATAGLEHVIVLIGINDIGVPGTASAPSEQAVTVADLIAGYRLLIARAHTKGLAIYGATLTPFEGAATAGYFTPAKDLVRRGANNWIRTSGEFDGVIDFDRAVRDPAQPSRMRPAFDSGDHLHPNDVGMQAMASAIALELINRPARIGAPAVSLR